MGRARIPEELREAGRLRRTPRSGRIKSRSVAAKKSVEQVRLFCGQLLVEPLETEYPRCLTADLFAGEACSLRANQRRRARRLGHELRLTTALQQKIPEDSRADVPTNGKKTMGLENDSLAIPQGSADPISLRRVKNHAPEVVEKRMILVEGAGVLTDGVQQSTEGRPRLAEHRVRMRGRMNIRARGMDARVDREGCLIEETLPFDNFARVIDTNQIRNSNFREVESKGVHPESFRGHRVTNRNMSRGPLVETTPGKD